MKSALRPINYFIGTNTICINLSRVQWVKKGNVAKSSRKNQEGERDREIEGRRLHVCPISPLLSLSLSHFLLLLLVQSVAVAKISISFILHIYITPPAWQGRAGQGGTSKFGAHKPHFYTSLSLSAGFAGELCNFEYNECESNPCQNAGECIDHIGSFECRCTKGYTGNRCQIKVSAKRVPYRMADGNWPERSSHESSASTWMSHFICIQKDRI